MRSAPATRLAPRPLRRFLSGLPPEMGVRGHRRSQEARWSSDGNDATLAPIAVSTTCAVPALMPSMRVRSTPENRHGASRPGCSPRPLMAFSSRRWDAEASARPVAPEAQRFELLHQASVVGGDLFLDGVVDPQRRLEVEQMVLAPVAAEVLRDL